MSAAAFVSRRAKPRDLGDKTGCFTLISTMRERLCAPRTRRLSRKRNRPLVGDTAPTNGIASRGNGSAYVGPDGHRQLVSGTTWPTGRQAR